MASEWRIDELERRSNGHGRSLESLSSRLAAVEQLANMLAAGGGGTFGGGGAGGSYYADPGIVTIDPETSESLDVYEVRSSGPIAVGERVVWNVMPDATVETERLLLSANRDGSFTVYNQACPPEAP